MRSSTSPHARAVAIGDGWCFTAGFQVLSIMMQREATTRLIPCGRFSQR